MNVLRMRMALLPVVEMYNDASIDARLTERGMAVYSPGAVIKIEDPPSFVLIGAERSKTADPAPVRFLRTRMGVRGRFWRRLLRMRRQPQDRASGAEF